MDLALVLALGASILIGGGEFLAAGMLDRVRGESLAATFLAVGFVVTLLAAPLVGGAWDTNVMALGALSGVLNGIALTCLYRAYSRVSVGVAAPIVAVLFAVVPVVFSALGPSDPLSRTAQVGVVAGLASVVLTSLDPSPSRDLVSGVSLAAASGLVYGVALTIIGSFPLDAGIWPLVPQRGVGFVASAILAVLLGAPAVVARREIGTVVRIGSFSSWGAILFVLGAQRGSLATVSIAGSQFAAVAVALAFIFRGERIRWWQTLGLGIAVLAVSLLAIG